jgi:hypothetical protein
LEKSNNSKRKKDKLRHFYFTFQTFSEPEPEINMYSSLQLFGKFFLFDPSPKHIHACRSGFFSFSLFFLINLPEGVVVGIWNFKGAPNSQLFSKTKFENIRRSLGAIQS